MFVTEEIKPPDHVEKPKKERKKRKPMTEEQKQVLRERLAKARAAKKAKKEGKVVQPKVEKPKVEKKKVELKVEEKTPIPTFKAPMVKPVPVKDEMAEMRAQLKLLQTRNKQQEKELMKAALEKEKLKKTGLDFLQKAKLAKEKQMATIKEEVEVPKVKAPVKEQPVAPVKKRYSTYKKSIWSKFE